MVHVLLGYFYNALILTLIGAVCFADPNSFQLNDIVRLFQTSHFWKFVALVMGVLWVMNFLWDCANRISISLPRIRNPWRRQKSVPCTNSSTSTS